ncbi:DUF887-domain-containing protein [Amniculicola lignicola CBS 123094]|uniref:DUF887-domain-containing protein n=1 Tax=Amniculicola lignicola CBS 123094 TaxID=1392246 RepID=A0A6A5WQ83_9PLEO|nr:DUF887-domain-containing protein [Amniculicola lignicola CBS 123094]
MHDPFPFPPPAKLSAAIQPWAEKLGLHTLPLHFHEVAFAFTIYHLTNRVLAPALSRHYFPTIYPNFNARTKLNWDVHIVSFVQSTMICAMALWVMWKDEERAAMGWREKVWGYTGASGLIQAFAGGYFVWDLYITLQNVQIFGLGMLAHAVSALFVFSLGFRPFLNYYGPTFILYELSSPFLNIHWFCDKLNMTGSKVQLYNGILLLTTFFSCRLCWGSYHSVRVFAEVWKAIALGNVQPEFSVEALDDGKIGGKSYESDIMMFAGEGVPLWLAMAYLASNLVLNGLNWYWFGKMIETLRKRFDPPLGTRKAEQKVGDEREKVLVEGTDVQSMPATPLVHPVKGEGYIDAMVMEKSPGGHHLAVGKTEVRNRNTQRAATAA